MKIALICGGVSSGGLYFLLSDIFCYAPDGDTEVTLFCSEEYIKPYKNINPKIKIQITEELAESKLSSLLVNRYSSAFINFIEDYNPSAVFFISGSCKKGLEKYNTYIVLHNQLYLSYSKIIKQLDLKVALCTMINAWHFNSNLKGLRHIIYSSKFSKEDAIKKHKGIDSTVIPLALNSKFHENLPETKNDFENDIVHLLNIGSIIPYKNQLVLIEALNILRKKRIKFRATFVGRIISKPYYYLCLYKIKKYGLFDSINFIPWVEASDVPSLIDSCDIYINTSETDTCGTSIEEGMARCKPVIASNTLFNYEKISNCGLYYNLDSPEELASAILQYLNDENLRCNRALEGQKKTKQWTLFETAKAYYEYIINTTTNENTRI
ncbi:glycosyltransferase [Bacteroides graminisolvens]|uniref:glycosyltransferase n=1 Tax=Bacteroides graminisolvens TaxID=477666 RepID=UPI0029C6A9EA|nr:glycosyltransferase [Bacteroides graminisolvens]